MLQTSINGNPVLPTGHTTLLPHGTALGRGPYQAPEFTREKEKPKRITLLCREPVGKNGPVKMHRSMTRNR